MRKCLRMSNFFINFVLEKMRDIILIVRVIILILGVFIHFNY